MATTPKTDEVRTAVNAALIGAGLTAQIPADPGHDVLTAMIGTIIKESVAGEPSLGMPHPHEVNLLNASATAPGTYTMDVSAQFPLGTTQIYITGSFQATTINTRVLIRTSAALPYTGCDTYLNAVASVASFAGIVRLTTARTFEIVVQTANATITLDMHEYWL